MKQTWTPEELYEHFTLTADERNALMSFSGHNQIGLAMLLKTFQYRGRFPTHKRSVPAPVIDHMAAQFGLSSTAFDDYEWRGRSSRGHRQWVRDRLGVREATSEDQEYLTTWLSEHPVLYQDQRTELLVEVLYQRCRELKLEPPTPGHLERIARAAVRRHEQTFFADTAARLSGPSRLALDQLLRVDDELDTDHDEMTVLG